MKDKHSDIVKQSILRNQRGESKLQILGELDAILAKMAPTRAREKLANDRHSVARFFGMAHCTCGHPQGHHYKEHQECLSGCGCKGYYNAKEVSGGAK